MACRRILPGRAATGVLRAMRCGFIAASGFALRAHESIPRSLIPANPLRALQAGQAGETHDEKPPDRSRYAKVPTRILTAGKRSIETAISIAISIRALKSLEVKRYSRFHAVRADGPGRSIRARLQAVTIERRGGTSASADVVHAAGRKQERSWCKCTLC
jgi:hypothetical protein